MIAVILMIETHHKKAVPIPQWWILLMCKKAELAQI
jgi:hypothetical protein